MMNKYYLIKKQTKAKDKKVFTKLILYAMFLSVALYMSMLLFFKMMLMLDKFTKWLF